MLIMNSGSVILELMMNGQDDADLGPRILRDNRRVHLCDIETGRLQDGPNPWPTRAFPTVGTYSLQLRRIIMRCLNSDPNDRPTLVRLKSQIDAWNTANLPANSQTPVSSGRDRDFRMNQPMPPRQHRHR
jgi:serine/threonine protein kinase